MTDMNILDLFLKASLLVKLIMLILIGFSIASWAIIIQRTRILNAAAREAEAFEDKFWSGIELSRLYQESQGKRDNLSGSEQIFYSGFKEFVRLHRANSHAPEAVVEGASRAMRISMNRELENLETHIPFLGTVGSIMGAAKINISGMQVGKTDVEGTNIMVLTIDNDVTADVIRQVTAIDGIFDAKLVNFYAI